MRATWSLFTAGVFALGCSGDIGDPSGTGPDAAAVLGPDASAQLDAAVDAPPLAARCDATDGDTQFLDPQSGHCYFWVDSSVMRDQAAAECQALDAHLATITSDAENVFVSNVAPDTPPDAQLPSSVDSWLGGNDLATEMTHVWDTGEPFVFTAWRTGEPNNSNVNDPNGEDCFVFEGDSNQWDDRSCTLVPHRYICEREP